MKLEFDMELTGMQVEQNRTTTNAKKVLWLSMNKMEQLAKQFAPVDIGLLRRSISLDPFFEGAKKYILSVGVDYGEDVEYGTIPHYVPIKPLEGWSRRVLGDKSLAGAIQHKIAISGTPAHPFFRPALLEVDTIWVRTYWTRVMA